MQSRVAVVDIRNNLKAPSTADILLSKEGLLNWYIVLIQWQNVAPDSL